MGRRPLPAEQKAAHGTPATRKTKAQREQEQREAAAAAIAELPIGATKMQPPAMLKAKHFEKALEVWNDLGPELERTNRLQPLHRNAFAMFCIYIGEWWDACADLYENGWSQKVPTIAKGEGGEVGYMERDRPSVRRRAEAFAAAQIAAKQFGLTPAEEYALFKDQSVVARENPSLFGALAPAQAATRETGSPAPTSVGAMAGMKSAGPPLTH